MNKEQIIKEFGRKEGDTAPKIQVLSDAGTYVETHRQWPLDSIWMPEA